jgi:tRNA A37 threonylcarbamoyladenosine dehydratase
MEFVGEIVCNVMGLTESKYQYVIDSMDANDWKVAREIEKRKNNDAIIQESA